MRAPLFEEDEPAMQQSKKLSPVAVIGIVVAAIAALYVFFTWLRSYMTRSMEDLGKASAIALPGMSRPYTSGTGALA